jgi:hypothetical protein
MEDVSFLFQKEYFSVMCYVQVFDINLFKCIGENIYHILYHLAPCICPHTVFVCFVILPEKEWHFHLKLKRIFLYTYVNK